MCTGAHRHKTTHINVHLSTHTHIHGHACIGTHTHKCTQEGCRFLLTLKSDGRVDTEIASCVKLSIFQTIKTECGIAAGKRRGKKGELKRKHFDSFS